MKTEPKLTLSQYKVGVFLTCRMKYYWTYNKGLTSKHKSLPLLVGDLLHKLLHLHDIDELTPKLIAAVPATITEMNPDTDHNLISDTCYEAARLVGGYINHYHAVSDYKVVSPELILTKEFPEFHLYARLDGLCEGHESGIWRLERKTTAARRGSYLRTHQTGLQTGISHWLMLDLMGKDQKIRGSVFDWIVKTKTPQYERSETPLDKTWMRMAQQTVYGVAASIKRGNFYPNLNSCEDWNGCEFKILCRNDSPQNRKDFYTDREEVKVRGQDSNFKDLLIKHSKLQEEN